MSNLTPEEEVQRNADIADWIVSIGILLLGIVIGRLTS